MKRSIISLTLLLGALLLNSQTSHAQNAIQYAPVTDYGTLIANIFGIQCEGVSNIQVIAAQPSIGRFENGQSLGLSSGLAMSTGVLAGSNQPSGAFFSNNMGTPPDADIANFGIQNGQVPTNYDATVISFDFTPIVSDTIRFSYVFASEEYPEYAMTSYTDRFLFLVSENGAAATNIAFIPGTTTVVEINSINQFINAQYYVDNTVGSSPNVASFVYDGYTTPLTAKFFAQVGSVYHIKLVIADVSDGVYDSAIFLDEQEAYNTIAGTVNVNNAPAEGLLEIFNFIQDTTMATPVESLIITNGTYSADSMPTGMYHVRFTPSPVLYPNTPPVYFTSGSDWTTATAIGLPCFLSNAGVFSDSLAVLNGSGSITGSIVIDTSFLKSVSIPLENALVFLHDAITNDVLAFTYSDAQGNYHFNQIPAGMYYIRLDVPYIPQVNQHQLNLLDGQQFFGVDFDVLTDGIHALNNIYLGVEENMVTTISVYPNPAKNSLYIQANEGSFSYQLCDLKGNILLSGNGKAGLNQLSLSEIANGVYLFKTNSGYTQRVVKQ